MNTVVYKKAEIRYKTYGNQENPAVLLLHGYLEALEIWEDFAPLLAKKYFVITMDIPGHGESGIYSSVHHMDDLAEVAFELVSNLGIKRIHVVGHSMGGYVALAFRENYHHSTLSCILFHSTCYPDTDEKKKNRDREIQLVKEGRKELIVNTNIPRAFADDNLEKFADEVDRARQIAIASNDEGVIALLRGMKERPDRCILLRDDNVPLLVIAGRKDNYIPFDVADGIKHLGRNVKISVLENSGHMGFIEEKARSFEILDHFFTQHAV